MARASLQCLVTMREDGQPRSRAQSARGFTLVELAIVVAIVGVLAVIAAVGYRKLVTSSKLTEARSMLQGIRVAQEAYKAERGVYVNIGTQGCPEPTLANTAKNKRMWDPACGGGGGTNTWALLAVHADGPVQFQYMTIAGVGGTPTGLGDGWVGGLANLAGTATSPRSWFIAAAKADLDANASTDPTELVTTSQGGEIYVRNEGQ